MISSVSELLIYRSSLNLLQKLYELTYKLPKSEKDTIIQIKRSAKSITANIAEGFSKHKSPREFKRFLQIAMGSSDETVTHLRTLYITAKYFRPKITELGIEYVRLSKQINKLHSSWVSE